MVHGLPLIILSVKLVLLVLTVILINKVLQSQVSVN